MTVGRRRFGVEGVVQGVGFRPFVHGLAERFALAGHVGNDTHGVVIEAEGEQGALTAFELALTTEAPSLAVVDRVTSTPMAPTGERGFVIVASDRGGTVDALIAADSATCDDCLAELFDPSDRRFGYPFVNCTNCGPRFTITTAIPYDRANTTMTGFTMCAACQAEYDDPADRRFHAQPTCCPACGPRLDLAVDAAAALLRPGPVVAA
jgi:hydrogenase maturation protein HypF